jgi:hypothetical protein
MPFRFLVLILLAILVTSCFYLYKEKTVAGGWGLALDDSWIHMVFARNLASGNGFSFNPHQPVSGATSPLWVFLMAAVFMLGIGPIWGAKLVGVVLLVGSCFFVYRITLRLTTDRHASLFASLVVALSPYLTWGALSGMETSLYTFLSIFGIWVHVRYLRSDGIRRYLPTVVFTLAGLARPECFLLLLFSWLDILIHNLRSRRRRLTGVRELLGYAMHPLLFVVITSPWFIFNYLTTGGFFPNTYGAKVGSGGLFGAISTGNLSAALTSLSIKPLYMFFISVMVLFKSSPVLLAFFAVGLFVVIRHYPRSDDDGLSLILPLAAILYAFGMGIFGHVHSLGQSHRYIHNLFPIFYLISSIGIFSVWPLLAGQLPQSRKERKAGAVFLVMTAALVIVILFGKALYLWIVNLIGPHTSLTHLYPRDLEFYWGNLIVSFLGISLMLLLLGLVILMAGSRNPLLRWKAVISPVVLAVILILMVSNSLSYAHFYALNVKNINDMHITLGKWLDDNTPQDALIALGDVGLITYTSQRRVIDVAGLMTPAIIPYQHQRGEEGILEYFQKVECPDYLIVYEDMYSGLRHMREHFQKVFEVQIENNTICGYPRMAVYAVRCGEPPADTGLGNAPPALEK